MNEETSVFVICVKVIMYLLFYNLHDCTFNFSDTIRSNFQRSLLTKNYILEFLPGQLYNFSKIKEYNYFLYVGLWRKEVTFALNSFWI